MKTALSRWRVLVLGLSLLVFTVLVVLLGSRQANADETPLALALRLTHNVCTANSLTDVEWDITGGTQPFVLSIDGTVVDTSQQRVSVSCGSLPPVRPGVTPIKIITGEVTDAAGNRATTTTSIPVSAPLTPPQLTTRPATGTSTLGVFPTTIGGFWSRGIPTDQTHAQAPFYLLRYRKLGDQSWQYSLYPNHHRLSGMPVTYDRSMAIVKLPHGTTYELHATALRSASEQHAPNALNWSTIITAITLEFPQNIQTASTHNTLTITRDTQPNAPCYRFALKGKHGVLDEVHYPPLHRHQAPNSHVPWPSTCHYLHPHRHDRRLPRPRVQKTHRSHRFSTTRNQAASETATTAQ